ncbi:C4-dicarboxylate ABC transporter permease [bacterium]|nr:C4-dicarboxylate ABC transporter permease [bacterium]
MSDALQTALQNTFSPETLLVILLAAMFGLFVGAIPGLTATMAVALMVPFTFFLDPVAGVAAIVTMEACCIFSGDIPTTLMRIPGTPSSAAYVDDAYALTQRHEHQKTLGVSLVFSVVGGLIGAVFLIVAAPQLARVAFEFSSYEYFWLCVLGLSCAAIVSRGSAAKGLLSLAIGLLIACVGIGSTHGVPRLTFGIEQLASGIDFIPAMIGLFGFSEVLRNVLKPAVQESALQAAAAEARFGSRGWLGAAMRDVFSSAIQRLKRSIGRVLTSSTIGAFIGMLPGAGADIAAWVSYAVSKRRSTVTEQAEYGSGSLQGIADATTANNASLAGAWIPALVLGIPGDSVTAIVIGVLLMKNVSPGPDIFQNPAQLPIVYSIYLTFVLANLLLLPLGFLAIRLGSQIVRVPRYVILPLILMACIVGSFAINSSYFDVYVMLCMGLLGFVLERFGVPLGPVVLGIILGPRLEETFVQSLTKSDSLTAFFSRPIAASLGALCIIVWLWPLISRLIGKNRRSTAAVPS